MDEVIHDIHVVNRVDVEAVLGEPLNIRPLRDIIAQNNRASRIVLQDSLRDGPFEFPAKARIAKLRILNKVFVGGRGRSKDVRTENGEIKRVRAAPFLRETLRDSGAAAQRNLSEIKSGMRRRKENTFHTCYYTWVKWLDRLERHFQFITIPQFPLFLATANGVCYIMAQSQPAFVDKLYLSPAAVANGEWWRVLTFLFVPPQMSPLFIVFWLLLLYQFAQALENAWGEFRFFFFYVFGAAVTAAAALILAIPIGNTWLNSTLFLAFATLFPDFEILLFFFIPMKVKYLAYFTWATTLYVLIRGGFSEQIGILSSLANYFLFFWPSLWRAALLRWQTYRNRKRLGL